MAITLKTNSVDKYGFVANGYSADLSGGETLVAAVAGKSIYVESVVISTLAAEIITLRDGAATIIGPIHTAATSAYSMTFHRPIKLTAATALTVIAAGAGETTVIVTGYIK